MVKPDDIQIDNHGQLILPFKLLADGEDTPTMGGEITISDDTLSISLDGHSTYHPDDSNDVIFLQRCQDTFNLRVYSNLQFEYPTKDVLFTDALEANRYTRSDWQHEVAENYTILGFDDWVAHKRESDKE